MKTLAVVAAATVCAATIGSATAQAHTRVVVSGYYGPYFAPAFYGWSPYAFGFAPYYGYGFGYGPYYGPYYAPAFYGWSPFAFGYAPYWGYGFGIGFAYGPAYGYGYAPFYGPYVYDDSASARVQVKPKQTEVYVDGYLAGVADNFDGTFQRLHIRPGGHEITLYLDGHRSVTERIYFSAGRTQKIKAVMVPLAPGEAPTPRPLAPQRNNSSRRSES